MNWNANSNDIKGLYWKQGRSAQTERNQSWNGVYLTQIARQAITDQSNKNAKMRIDGTVSLIDAYVVYQNHLITLNLTE